MKPMNKSKKVAFVGVLTALALIFSYVEVLIPFSNLGIPGFKLGLANIIVVVLMYYMNAKVAGAVSVIRILISSLLFGMTMLPYSLAGGALSFLIMLLLKKTGKFSVVGVSLAGGVMHNVGQLAVAALVIENFRMVYYLPILLGIGAVTGLLIGLCAKAFLPHLPGMRERFKSGEIK